MVDEEDVRLRLPLAALLVVIAAGGAVDLALDAPKSWLSAHVIYEVALIAGALGTASWLWLGWRNAERTSSGLRRLVAERQAERDAWQASARDALAGLAAAIDRQLDRWGLTPAEREVVSLVLRGRSHKQIASATGRSERTVRQHAAAAYRKAGLGGRAELAAFFLTDLPLPRGPEIGGSAAGGPAPRPN
jgi:DNA-binding CsgD family transcriptional regulator